MQYFMRNANTNRDPSQYSIWCISYSLSVSLDFLRWRNFSSCSTFSGKNPADLFSGSNGLLSVCFLVIHQPFCSLRCHTCNGRVFLYSFRNFSRAKAHGANLSDSDSCAIFLRRFFLIGDDVFINSLSFMVLSCKAMCRSSSHHGAGCFYSDSLAWRRWRRLISPRMAALINCPVLSPSSFTFSMPSIISWAIRAVTDCDFAFFGPVAMSNSLCFWCKTIYTKKNYFEGLTCKTLLFYIVSYTLLMQGTETTKPRTVGAVTGLLTTNDSRSIEVAMLNHTTHPQGRDSHNLNKYIWRFIALSTAQPRVITIEATSEQEARQQSPAGCVMVFAARIRQEVRHD
ncbi:host cell division inhibitor Icd-like protein [Escherichia coli]|nr:host cell division inhibitor Icd-like protein [Escherichia coli]EKF4352319.1 host cell division inhibitor Icd-like protein [Escherichia coli O136]EKP4087688.1 host cell division inhibitor Icd-like protein [Escherichia coli O157]EHK5651348.1 host cell division inhibitor Icd-like protein [Escherichia coli]EHP9946678.1 host cell division inhibitor Icd-like protein [Escherichia coli]